MTVSYGMNGTKFKIGLLTLAYFYISFSKGYSTKKQTQVGLEENLLQDIFVSLVPKCRSNVLPVVLFCLLLISGSVFSQIRENPKEKQIEELIESIAESDESDIENSAALDQMIRNSENQANINIASADELEKLGILDFRQVQNLIRYRSQYGSIVSIYELAAIDGFTPDVITSLAPFIRFDVPSDSVGNLRKGVYQRILSRIKTSFPEAKGYRSVSESRGAAYPGAPVSVYTRYNLEIPGKLEFGFIADKDPGEEFFRGSNKSGFDHYSGFISLKSNGFLRQLTIGDFLMRFGQGLNFGTGSGLGKSGNVLGIVKPGQGVKPYASTDENLFFRGVSATVAGGPFRMMLFYSNKNRDANIDSDPVTDDPCFTSLQTSGYHRTASEIDDERSVNEQILGGYGELRFRKFRVGALFAHQQFNLPMVTGNSAYKAKSFSGRENLNLGLDYQVALHNIQFFGEAGMSKSRKPAFVQGMVWRAHPQMSLALFYRHFDAGFHTFYGSSLSESSGNRNESGLYTSLLAYPFPKIKISGYADFYRFPFLTYSTSSPESGKDYMVQIDFSWTKRLLIYGKAKYESKPQKMSVASGIPGDFDESTTRIRLHVEYLLSEKFTLRSRFEYSGYSFYSTNEKGFLLFQDILYTPFRKLNLWFRYACFNTDGYNSRIYTYENDLLYSFSIPEFHGNGNRIYLNLKWAPTQRISTYLKVGCTIHNGANSWGSGNDVTSGNIRTELRALLSYKF